MNSKTKRMIAAILAASTFSVPASAQILQPRLTVPQTIRIAHDAGFECSGSLAIAVAVAIAESGLRPGLFSPQTEAADGRPYGVRPDGSPHGDRGLFQISSYWHPEVTDAQAYDPVQAAAEAFRISRGGTYFDPWNAYKAGRHEEYLYQWHLGYRPVAPAVDRFCNEPSGGGIMIPIFGIRF